MSNFPPLLIVWAMFTLNPVTISVYPAFSMAPATFRITVMVPRDARNRHLCFGFSGAEDRKSCLSIDGTDARRSWTVFWDVRTAGEYDAVATLTRMEEGHEKRYVSRQPFRVIGIE